MSDIKNLTLLGAASTSYTYEEPASNQLETFDYQSSATQAVGFITSEFTSLCPKTGQPDFARIEIVYVPRRRGIESKSLKLYLFRYRNHGAFHEDCISKILRDVVEAIEPWYIKVIGDFTPRGGIAIKPVSVFYAPTANRNEIDTTIRNYHQATFNR
ncbi:7-cyano-7-deazaguanine reductase [Krasilnikovia cinnamomea]|uniref:NADPH-dependent 7-cyano-7-deazaguanine reductase n=1 Tax=Krasilnikovia cinnamomea TaxID=349313 RepID=A0A4Q7ZIL8_9ACTN|nr:preQ(1) synthase [Krasilnikovia cinnamomea]RZU50692.1 7-cyano-7-deazaguanine reductase [Krasilnikovia cinnamomea]